MEIVRDHPVIESLMQTGYPYGEPKMYQCPVCGEDIGSDDVLYMAIGEVVGCDHCIFKTTPLDVAGES